MTTLHATDTETMVRVCHVDQLTPELGVAALVGETQVALFLLSDGSVHAVQNLDPFSGASVISRGITGSKGDIPTIASPIYKQVFSLLTGECLSTMDKEPKNGASPNLATYRITSDNGQVYINLAGGE
ncbi:nitrite reductase small subunit NirD [Demequina aurantiaca]|uniref:nitrite reductase small subunit NirD n=1 Tax=Demequina aurantiaca TaxID=676200 RepID=UPI000781BFEC|nr:nitrite reductase small subunit NirD [Demequina aurantiaca]